VSWHTHLHAHVKADRRLAAERSRALDKRAKNFDADARVGLDEAVRRQGQAGKERLFRHIPSAGHELCQVERVTCGQRMHCLNCHLLLAPEPAPRSRAPLRGPN
jgi:hypothetical protein